MSDTMLLGVLRMPYELAMSDELSRRQFYDRAQEAADRIAAAPVPGEQQAPVGAGEVLERVEKALATAYEDVDRAPLRNGMLERPAYIYPAELEAALSALADLRALRSMKAAAPAAGASDLHAAIKAVDLPEPFDWCYEWDGPRGSREFSSAPRNGRKPDRAVALYTAKQVRAYARDVAAELAARHSAPSPVAGSPAAGEPVAWEATTPCYTKYVTDSRYRKFSPSVQQWYRPYRCANCATHPPSPAPLSQEQRDADPEAELHDWHSTLERARASIERQAGGQGEEER